jgi:hypothetical protein
MTVTQIRPTPPRWRRDMSYRLPIYGIWSADRKTMLETDILDLDDAKDRVWVPFDAGDESVEVVEVCHNHRDTPLSECRELT